MFCNYKTAPNKRKRPVLVRGIRSRGQEGLGPPFLVGEQSMCSPPNFLWQVFQFKLRSHMSMYWKVSTVYMTDKIWFLRREGNKASDSSIDCSYRPAVSCIFTLNHCHKFTWSYALSEWTFSEWQVWLWITFCSLFWHLYNDSNWPLGFLPLNHAARHTHTEIGTTPGPPFFCHSDAWGFSTFLK